MKRAILLGLIFLGGIFLEAYAQCTRIHYFCSGQLSEEEQKEQLWSINNQSKSAPVAKGQEYNLSFIAYTGYDYRLTICTDAVQGAAEPVNFKLSQDAIVRVKDAQTGQPILQKQPEVIFDNSSEGNQPFVKFATDKTKKFYLCVKVPSSGDSKNKQLGMEEKVCLGVLLEHKKTPALGF